MRHLSNHLLTERKNKNNPSDSNCFSYKLSYNLKKNNETIHKTGFNGILEIFLFLLRQLTIKANS